MSELAEVWFEEATKLPVGEAIFVRVADKKEQTIRANEFDEERARYEKLDPVLASQIFINKTVWDRKLYVVLERKYRAPFTAFHRNLDGKFSTVSVDPDRRRMLRLMVKDGIVREEIEEKLNGLTEEEVKEFFPGKEEKVE